MLAALLFASSAVAQAAAPSTKDVPVEAKGVGLSGGIIAGAEVVLIVEAIIDVEPVWAWWVFPILGAAGGGVGGYYLEKASPGGAVGMLIGAMALLIPTAVAISVSRAYDPEEETGTARPPGAEGSYSFEMSPDGEDDGDEGTFTEVESRPENVPDETDPEGEPEPADETPGPEADSGAISSAMTHLRSGSLFHIGRDMSAGFGIPAVDVRPTVVSNEETMFGMRCGVEVRVPLISIDLP